MTVGEDVPILIPISIVLTIFLLFMVSLFVNFSQQSDMLQMSQVAQNLAEYMINIQFPAGSGMLSYIKLGPQMGVCGDLKWLNITSNFRTTVNITDVGNKNYWCFTNSNSNKKVTTSLTIIAPVLMYGNNQTNMSKVTISVSR